MRLPDYKFVQGGNTRVNMSPQAASAAGRGFARMSEDLAGVGMQVAGLFEKAEEVHDQGKPGLLSPPSPCHEWVFQTSYPPQNNQRFRKP